MKSLNINSKLVPGNESFAVGHLDFLTSVWETTPIFLVDPPLMDFLYPPEKMIDYDYEMLKRELGPRKDDEALGDERRDIPPERPAERPDSEIGEEIDREMDRIGNILNEARRIELSSSSSFVAIGVYERNVSPETQNHILATSGKEIEDRPTIFICPERICEWAEKLEMAKEKQNRKGESGFDILFACVYLHELSHRYTDISHGRYSTWWGRFIEESFANAVAFSLIPDDKASWRRALLKEAMSRQPLPYRGYSYWLYQYSGLLINTGKKGAYKDLLNLWARNEPSLLFAEMGKECQEILAPLSLPLSAGAFFNSIQSILPGYTLSHFSNDFNDELRWIIHRFPNRLFSHFEWFMERDDVRWAARTSSRSIWKLLAYHILKELLR